MTNASLPVTGPLASASDRRLRWRTKLVPRPDMVPAPPALARSSMPPPMASPTSVLPPPAPAAARLRELHPGAARPAGAGDRAEIRQRRAGLVEECL